MKVSFHQSPNCVFWPRQQSEVSVSFFFLLFKTLMRECLSLCIATKLIYKLFQLHWPCRKLLKKIKLGEFVENVLQVVLLAVLYFKQLVKNHCVARILLVIWKLYLENSNHMKTRKAAAFKSLRLKSCLYETKSFHPGETSHLNEIAAEWCISLCKSKSFLWEWIHPTQVRSHINAGEISIRWDDFYPCKQFLPGCLT